MHRTIGLLCLSLVGPSFGATYYISPSGNDSTGDGSSGNRWLTVTNAYAHMNSGDTLIFGAGTYALSSADNFFGEFGVNKNNLTFRAETAHTATNQFNVNLRATNCVFSGLVFRNGGVDMYKVATGGSMPGPKADYTLITNCMVINGSGGFTQTQASDHDPLNAACYCLVVDCQFRFLTNGGCLSMMGYSNRIEKCVLRDCWMQDSVYPFGSNNVISQCVFSNMQVYPEGLYPEFSNHPDILQCFGDNGDWGVDNLFERNYVINCPIQLMDYSFRSGGGQKPIGAGGVVQTNNSYWGITLRNNVFVGGAMQCSIDVPNVKFFNNTFRNTSAPIAYAFYDPTWYSLDGNSWMARGWGTGGQCVNNVFDNAAGYAVVDVGPNRSVLTNGDGTVCGKVFLYLDNGVFSVWGAYSNLSGTITSGVLYGACGDIYNWGAGYFAGGTFSLSTNGQTVGACDYDSTQQGYFLNGTFKFRLNTTLTTGEAACLTMPIYTAPTSETDTVVTNSGWNWNGKVGESGALTGTDPKLAATNTWPVNLNAAKYGSALIDAGTNLGAVGITNDYLGVVRPQNGTIDVGAFEFDPSLQVHLSFDYATNGFISPDDTGYGHNAVNGISTNNIVLTNNGAWSTPGGYFHYVGTIPPPDPYGYQFSQYGEITNTTGIQYLTNATFSLWAWINTNADAVMQLLDCSDASVPGSFMFGKNYQPQFGFAVSGAGTNRVTFPNNLIQAGGGSPNYGTLTFDLYTVSVSCTNNQVIAYTNGAPYTTNTLWSAEQPSIASLVVAGNLTVGGLWHGANMPNTWPNGSYPNAGFPVGTMDDVRIYNRTLSAAEVANLYAGTGAALTSGGGGSQTNTPVVGSPVAAGTGVFFGTGVKIN